MPALLPVFPLSAEFRITCRCWKNNQLYIKVHCFWFWGLCRVVLWFVCLVFSNSKLLKCCLCITNNRLKATTEFQIQAVKNKKETMLLSDSESPCYAASKNYILQRITEVIYKEVYI